MRFFLSLLILFAAAPVWAQQEDVPKLDPAFEARLQLAEEMHGIWPIRPKVEAAIDRVAEEVAVDKRFAFKAAMRKAVKYDLLEEESIRVMAETFTEDELKAMIAFYDSPVGRSISNKTEDYARALQPVMTKMLDQALMDVRIGQ